MNFSAYIFIIALCLSISFEMNAQCYDCQIRLELDNCTLSVKEYKTGEVFYYDRVLATNCEQGQAVVSNGVTSKLIIFNYVRYPRGIRNSRDSLCNYIEQLITCQSTDSTGYISSIVDNGDGSYTHNDGNGNLTTINTNSSGSISSIVDNGNGTYTHNDGNGSISLINTNTEVDTSTLVDNGDGSYTHTAGGISTTFLLKNGLFDPVNDGDTINVDNAIVVNNLDFNLSNASDGIEISPSAGNTSNNLFLHQFRGNGWRMGVQDVVNDVSLFFNGTKNDFSSSGSWVLGVGDGNFLNSTRLLGTKNSFSWQIQGNSAYNGIVTNGVVKHTFNGVVDPLMFGLSLSDTSSLNSIFDSLGYTSNLQRRGYFGYDALQDEFYFYKNTGWTKLGTGGSVANLQTFYNSNDTIVGNKIIPVNQGVFQTKTRFEQFNGALVEDTEVRQVASTILMRTASTLHSSVPKFIMSSSSNEFRLQVDSITNQGILMQRDSVMKVTTAGSDFSGDIILNEYGNGNKIGAPTYLLGVNSDGDVIETLGSSSSAGNQNISWIDSTGNANETLRWDGSKWAANNTLLVIEGEVTINDEFDTRPVLNFTNLGNGNNGAQIRGEANSLIVSNFEEDKAILFRTTRPVVGNTRTVFELLGTGQVVMNQYGINQFQEIDTSIISILGVDTLGQLIEIDYGDLSSTSELGEGQNIIFSNTTPSDTFAIWIDTTAHVHNLPVAQEKLWNTQAQQWQRNRWYCTMTDVYADTIIINGYTGQSQLNYARVGDPLATSRYNNEFAQYNPYVLMLDQDSLFEFRTTNKFVNAWIPLQHCIREASEIPNSLIFGINCNEGRQKISELIKDDGLIKVKIDSVMLKYNNIPISKLLFAQGEANTATPPELFRDSVELFFELFSNRPNQLGRELPIVLLPPYNGEGAFSNGQYESILELANRSCFRTYVYTDDFDELSDTGDFFKSPDSIHYSLEAKIVIGYERLFSAFQSIPSGCGKYITLSKYVVEPSVQNGVTLRQWRYENGTGNANFVARTQPVDVAFSDGGTVQLDSTNVVVHTNDPDSISVIPIIDFDYENSGSATDEYIQLELEFWLVVLDTTVLRTSTSGLRSEKLYVARYDSMKNQVVQEYSNFNTNYLSDSLPQGLYKVIYQLHDSRGAGNVKIGYDLDGVFEDFRTEQLFASFPSQIFERLRYTSEGEIQRLDGSIVSEYDISDSDYIKDYLISDDVPSSSADNSVGNLGMKGFRIINGKDIYVKNDYFGDVFYKVNSSLF